MNQTIFVFKKFHDYFLNKQKLLDGENAGEGEEQNEDE